MTEKLSDAPTPPSRPVLLSGTAPQSFLYVAPTFVLFDKSQVTCNKTLHNRCPPTSSLKTIRTGITPGSTRMHRRPPGRSSSRSPANSNPSVQFVQIRIPFPLPWTGWPQSIEFNVTEEMVDALAGDQVDTLLCPKLWQTSAG